MRFIKYLCLILFTAAICYGAGRLYYQLTGGFLVSNITNTSLAYDPRWTTRTLEASEQNIVDTALKQDYYYLGKGCQSYVFLSKDGNTVIKFPKYQRFRPQAWIDLLTWIPSVQDYQEGKEQERRHFMEKMFRGWTLGFDPLSHETGVMFVHVNKTPHWSQKMIIHDKLGLTHELELGQMEFMLQKRAVMLDQALHELMKNGDEAQAQLILDRLVAMVMAEYLSGIADNDHALLQNTGVIDGYPIHIDVGQFVRNSSVKKPEGYERGLFNKTYRLHEWLQKEYPNLAEHLKGRVIAVIGPSYYYLPPYVYRPNFDKLPDDGLTSP